MERIVLHVDFDYFYAQCEEVRRPELRSKPVCVCVFSGRGGDSGAVATANYAARKFGAGSGIPISLAKRRLEGTGAEFLPVDFAHYDGVSDAAMHVMRGHADVFERVGRDEAYLDVTARTGGDYARATHLAQQLKNAVRAAVSLSCSVGVSPNRMLSKVASDHKKPDGLTVVRPKGAAAFLAPLGLRAIPGIGGKTEKRLAAMGLATVGDLARLDVFALNREFGRRAGTHLYNAARGIDGEPVQERGESLQYGRITTLKRDSAEYEFLEPVLLELCGQVCAAAAADSRAFRSVGVHLVLSDMAVRTRSRMLRGPTCSLAELQRAACHLLRGALEEPGTARRLGVRVADLSGSAGQGDITSYF